MIRIARGDEPATLRGVRDTQLADLRRLGRAPTSDEIDGYRVVADELWTVQHYKCCYCEGKIPAGFNDVEHYRPKGRADRRPGCVEQHGYWWLAFTWSNLLFACPGCNRSGKNDQFPLSMGCVALCAEEEPPCGERPLLLDAGAESNPVEHLIHVLKAERPGGPERWRVQPRDGSPLGFHTVEVCKLNRRDLLELRGDHVRGLERDFINALRAAVRAGRRGSVVREYQRALQLLEPRTPYLGLTYDALRALVPDPLLHPWCPGWPAPAQVGLPPDSR